MVNHLKRYLTFALCALALNIALISPAYLTATQEAPSQEETAQVAENNEKSDESDENEIKKPTFTQSWRKVITLHWKELTKADAWNIGASIAGITALGLLYRYFLKSGKTDNTALQHWLINFDKKHNMGQDNSDNTILIGLSKALPDDIQRAIALRRIDAFLLLPKEYVLRIHNIDEHMKNLKISGFNPKMMTIFDEIDQSFVKKLESVLSLPEFNTKKTPLSWIGHNLIIPQADLIARAWSKMAAGEDFIIALPDNFNQVAENESQEQADGRTYFTFPDQVREYLRTRLKIRR